MSQRALGLMTRRLKAVGGESSFWELHHFLWEQDRIGIDSCQGAVRRGIKAGSLIVDKPSKTDSRTWKIKLNPDA